MRKIILPFLVALAILFGGEKIHAATIPSPTSDFYVNDFANILNPDTKQSIFESARALDATSSVQIVIVTIPSLAGDDLETYATTLFRDYQIGNQEKNSGLLILLARDDRQLRIEVGYGLEGILPDGKVGRLQDEFMIPALRENNFDLALTQGYNAFHQEILAHLDEVGVTPPPEEDLSFADIIILIIIITIIIISFFNAGNSSGGNRSSGFGGFGGSGGGGFRGGGGSSGGGGASRRF
jgi:uncharacterized protein